MKQIGVVVLVIGLILGTAQAFYTYEKQHVTTKTIAKGTVLCAAMMPECGVCLDEISGDQCIKKETKIVRGFPLSTTGSGVNYKTNQPLGFGHVLNVVLFILPGLALLTIGTMQDKRRNSTKTSFAKGGKAHGRPKS